MKPRFGAQGGKPFLEAFRGRITSFLEIGNLEESTKRDPKDMASLSFPLYRHGVAGS